MCICRVITHLEHSLGKVSSAILASMSARRDEDVMSSVLLGWLLEAERAKTLALWLRLMSDERRGRMETLDVLREIASRGSKRRQRTEAANGILWITVR